MMPIDLFDIDADPSEILLDDFDEDALPDDFDELEAVDQESNKP